MKKYLLLFILNFSFTFSNVKAQCPSGNVELRSQDEVFLFVATYPNCDRISGDLRIGDSIGNPNIYDISGLQNLVKIDGRLTVIATFLTSLNGLQNIQELGSLVIVSNQFLQSITELNNVSELNTGPLEVGSNIALQSLNGLNNIQTINGHLYLISLEEVHSLTPLSNLNSVGGFMFLHSIGVSDLNGLENLTNVGGPISISQNLELLQINSLENLTTVGGFITLFYNPLLTSLNGLQNINPTSFAGEENGLSIELNENLTTCNLPNVCEYLSWDSIENPREIIGNTGNCIDEQAVLAACGLGVTDVENDSSKWNVVYQKNKGSFIIQSNGFQIGEINIYDLSGKLVKTVQNLNSNKEGLRFFTPENVLIIKVTSKEGKVYAKKVLVK